MSEFDFRKICLPCIDFFTCETMIIESFTWFMGLLWGTKHNMDVIKELHKHHQSLLPLLKMSCKSLLKGCDQRVFGS